jgi:hypothetical protein
VAKEDVGGGEKENIRGSAEAMGEEVAKSPTAIIHDCPVLIALTSVW